MTGWVLWFHKKFGSRRALLCPLALPFIRCVTLDKLLTSLDLSLPLYQIEIIILTSKIILHGGNDGGMWDEESQLTSHIDVCVDIESTQRSESLLLRAQGQEEAIR